MKAYEGRREEAHAVVIESELAGPYIRRVCEAGFTGTASELLAKLDDLADDGNVRRKKEWPKTPRKLTGIVKRLSPALRKLGYVVERGEHERAGTPWRLCKREGL